MKRATSKYSKTFDDRNEAWVKNRKHNLMFLKTQQAYANNLLKVKGWLVLNDIYDMLGFPRTKEGCFVGWIYEENNQIGDNFIDFDIHCKGNHPNVILDFNVDGNIIDRIPE